MILIIEHVTQFVALKLNSSMGATLESSADLAKPYLNANVNQFQSL